MLIVVIRSCKVGIIKEGIITEEVCRDMNIYISILILNVRKTNFTFGKKLIIYRSNLRIRIFQILHRKK